MIRLAAALLLVPLVTAVHPGKGKLFDPPKVDDSPTAYACTADSLARGDDCVFEGQAGARASAADNQAQLQALAEPTCQAALASAAPADTRALHADCVARMRDAARSCAKDGALLDGAGRFTAEGRDCYHALFIARVHARSLASAAPNCCTCLSEHHCAGAGESCVSQAANAKLSVRCADADACAAACTELLSEPSPPASSGRQARAK